MKLLKKLLVVNFIVLTLLTMPIVSTNLNVTFTVQAASSIKISKKKKTLRVGDKYTLKITGTSKKVKWKSSNKKVATVNSKGKVKAKKKGTATITAKVGGKKYKCKITVKKASKIKAGNYTLEYGKYTDKYGTTYTLKPDGTYTCSSKEKGGRYTKKGKYIIYNFEKYEKEVDKLDYPIGFSGKWMIALNYNNKNTSKPYLMDSYNIYENNQFYYGQTDEVWNYKGK